MYFINMINTIKAIIIFKSQLSEFSIKEVIREQIQNYEEAMEGARERLANALEIIVVAYYAALIKRRSDEMLTDLMSNSF